MRKPAALRATDSSVVSGAGLRSAAAGLSLALVAAMSGFGPPAQAQDREAGVQEVEDGDGAAAPRRKGGAAAPAIRSTVEGMVLWRDGPHAVPLTGAHNANAGFTPLVSSELGIGDNASAGLRATFEGEILGQPVEMSAFYVLPFLTGQLKTDLSSGGVNTTPTTNAVYANDPGGDIANYTNSQNIGKLFAHHGTKLLGAELNAKDALGLPGFMLGARMFYFGEDLNTVTWKNSDTTRDAVAIQTDNYLLGLQAGLAGMADLGAGIRVGGSVKAGLYANQAMRLRSFLSRNQTQARAQQNSLDGTAFAQGVEINPRLEIELADGVTFSAGGTLLWLNGVSGALPHYATVTDLADRDLRARDDALFYGVQAGLTVDLNALAPARAPSGVAGAAGGSAMEGLDARIAELEAGTARSAPALSVDVYGRVNRMVMAWDDSVKSYAHIVDNVNSPTLFGFEGAAKIARGWTTGFNLEIAAEQGRSNAVSQLGSDNADGPVDIRFADWWLRSNRYGRLTVGQTGTATYHAILNDLGGTVVAASPSIALIGGDIILRAADDLDLGAESLITRTVIGDFVGGATLDTQRRNAVRYDSPLLAGLQLSAAAGENDFWDVALRYKVDFDQWRFRAAVGYMRDTDAGSRLEVGGTRDRREWKGSASVLNVPTGLFVTAAFVNREFHGSDPSNQAVFGENTVGLATPPGTSRPDLRYGYLKAGLRKSFTSLGDTKLYAEGAIAHDGLTGLREGGPLEVTDSQLRMLGAGIVQDIDSAGMQIYLGFRHFEMDIEGVRDSNSQPGGIITSPAPIGDVNIIYTGTRIEF
ncbi:MAG TPA: hypothetical protein VFZ16_09395 [Hyphomicrobiaceae bacterium]|nr:hypothetical protein [Hyphomicrobiaceae bacterium]